MGGRDQRSMMASRRRRCGIALVAAATSLFATVGQWPANAFASGSANLHLSKTVGSAVMTPQLALTLGVDRNSAIPGDALTYTAKLSNTGASLLVSGDYTAQNTGATTATILSYFDAVATATNSHCGTTITNQGNNTSQWTPIAGTAAALNGYTPVVPPPIAGSMTLTVTPVPSDGVTYPSSGDRILGTQLNAGATASWHYSATLQLTPQQVNGLLSPQIDHVRNTLHAEMGQRTQQGNGQPASVDTDFCQQLANGAPSGAASNATITITPHGFGSPLVFNSSNTPALASIASGSSVTVSGTATVPVPAPKASTDTDSQYVQRLASVEGSTLTATASASASSSGGPVSAGPVTSPPTTVHLPILGITKTGPTSADAGTTQVYPLTLSNTGGATAGGLTVTDTVPDGTSGTVSGVPATLAAGATSPAQASYAIPASEGPGPLTDTASVTWHDANGNAYGPVSGMYTTTVTSSLVGATLTLSPSTAGPDVVGTTQAFTATLLDRNDLPLTNRQVDFAVTGVNPVTGSGTTDSNGRVSFSYSGSNDGADTVQGTVTQDTVVVQSNTATVGWINPVTPISTSTVQGNFFAESPSAATFVAKPGDTPAFGQSFPTIDFNPPKGTVNGTPPGYDPTTRPFTDITTDPMSNFNGTLVAQGNGVQAGIGSLNSFDAVFTANFVVAKPGDVTFNIVADDGFLLGVGGGASRVSGAYENAPPSNASVFDGYPLAGAFDEQGGSAPQTFPVTVHFPAAGTYPYELDYFECCGSELSLTFGVSQFTADTSAVSVHVAYADGLRPAGSIFPFPWLGSPNVIFEGCQPGCQFDSGAVRVDNNTTAPVTVNSLTVDFAGCHFDIWPKNLSLPGGQIMIFSQTVSGASSGCDNRSGQFDTSDLPYAGFCGQNGIIPQVNLTIGGVTTTYADTTQILDTGGQDAATCGGGNESRSWTKVGGNGVPINVPLPPAVNLALTPATVNGAVVGSTHVFTVSALDGSGQPVADLPVTLSVFGANTQQLPVAATNAAGQAQIGYVGAHAGSDTLTATAFISGLRAVSNAGTVTWSIPSPSGGPTSTSSGAQPPSISGVSPADGTVLVASTPVTATIAPPSGGSIASWSVTLQDVVNGGSPLTLASGSGTPPSTLATINAAGLAPSTYALSLSATSGAGGTATFTEHVSTGNGGGTTAQAPPSITSPSPADGSVITAPVPITASFTPPPGETIASWSVSVQPPGGAPQQTLASGTGAPPSTLATFDPTLRPDGDYVVTVAATASGGGVQTVTTTLSVVGTLKLGRYSTTFRDLSVPVAGFPMNVDRTYDSTDKTVGDFGVGWHVSVSSVDVAANRELGAGGWTEYPSRCIFGLCFYNFSTSTPHFVTVTFPDNHQEIFDFTPSGGAVLFYFQGASAFTARPGTTSTLQVTGDQSVTNGFDGNLYDSSGNVFNPTRFTLTTRDGRVLVLDTTLGLVSETDANGNSLTVDSAGIHSSTGASITFTRDAANRITQVTGPSGQAITYSYYAAGDLTGTVLATGETLAYTYDSNHDLLRTDGPAGAALRTVTYDSAGRVASITDAAGHVISVSDNASARQQVITDANGQTTTVLSYDALGDLIQRDVSFGGTTLTDRWTYDGTGHTLSHTDAAGHTYTAQYDSSGDLLKLTTPAGRSLQTTYNARGESLTVTDNAGGVTTNAYDAHGNLVSTTDALGHTSTYTYNAAGLPLTQTDARGDQWSATYDAAGHRSSLTDPAGHVSHDVFDGSGNLTSATDGVGNTTTYAYSPGGQLVSTTNPLGGVTKWTYDALGRVATETDADGGVSKWSYDAVGHVSGRTDPLGRTTTYAYDADGRLTSTTTPDGAVTAYAYDGAGRLTATTDPLGRVTQQSYDAAGNVIRTTLPGGAVTRATYDADGHVTSQVDARGGVTASSYDSDGNLIAVTDPLGRTTTYVRDAAGRVTSTTDPAGHVTTQAYDAGGNLISVTDPLGATTAYGYDGSGRQVSVTTPSGLVTLSSYDAGGRLAASIDPAGESTTWTYDPAGNLTGLTNPAGDATHYSSDAAGRRIGTTDALGRVTAYAYDAAGQMTSSTDARGHTTAYAYDAAGRQSRITDALGGTVNFTHDAAGQLTAVTDADGAVTRYGYDALGNRTSVRDPLGRTTTSAYDASGDLLQVTDARGQATTSTYDAAGELVSRSSAAGHVSLAYDAAGRRISMTDPTGATTTAYDADGHITGVSTPEGGVGYAYDGDGRRTTMTLPGGRQVGYQYDAAGRVIGLTDGSGGTTTFSYDADSHRTGITRPNGTRSSLTYDAAGEITAIAHSGGSGSLDSVTYSYDAAGNRTAATTPAGSESNSYDSLNRLTQASYPGGDVVGYSYDAAGNRVSSTRNGSTTGATYDAAGEMTSMGATAFTYDADGNLVSAGPDTYTWDAEGRLVGASVSGASTSYTYDGDGLRVASSTGTASSHDVYDRVAGLAQLVDDGSLAYIQQGGLQEQIDRSGAATYPLTDALGSVSDLTNGSGAVIGSTSYDAYGSPRSHTGASSVFGFTGEATDANGLVNLRARLYDPASGRFLSADTVQPNAPGTQGFNRYTYTADNPTTEVDPSGHEVLADVAIEEEAIAAPIEAEIAADAAENAAIEEFLAARAAGLAAEAPALTAPGLGTAVAIAFLLAGTGLTACVTLGPCAQPEQPAPPQPGPAPTPAPLPLPMPQPAPNPGPGTDDQPRQGELVYRVWGGGTSEFGASWTPLDPRGYGPDQYRIDAGLPDRLNAGTSLTIAELTDPAAVAIVRPARRVTPFMDYGLPQYADSGVAYRTYDGGLLEFVIPNAAAALVPIQTLALNPPYGGPPAGCVPAPRGCVGEQLVP